MLAQHDSAARCPDTTIAHDFDQCLVARAIAHGESYLNLQIVLLTELLDALKIGHVSTHGLVRKHMLAGLQRSDGDLPALAVVVSAHEHIELDLVHHPIYGVVSGLKLDAFKYARRGGRVFLHRSDDLHVVKFSSLLVQAGYVTMSKSNASQTQSHDVRTPFESVIGPELFGPRLPMMMLA